MTSAEPVWRQVAPKAVLLGGLAVAGAIIAPEVPRGQTVVFRLPVGQPVGRLEAEWTRAGHEAPAGGVTLNFPAKAPSSVRHEFSSPNGSYDLAISVKQRSGSDWRETVHHRQVLLEGTEIIVPLIND